MRVELPTVLRKKHTVMAGVPVRVSPMPLSARFRSPFCTAVFRVLRVKAGSSDPTNALMLSPFVLPVCSRLRLQAEAALQTQSSVPAPLAGYPDAAHSFWQFVELSLIWPISKKSGPTCEDNHIYTSSLATAQE